MSSKPTDNTQGNDAAEAEATAGPINIDGWRDADIRNIKVAAYQSGRLLNKLQFHAQQSWLLGDLRELQIAESTIMELVTPAIHVSADHDPALTQWIQDYGRRLSENRNCEQANEELFSANSTVIDAMRDGVADIDRIREEACESLLLSWVESGIERLRLTFLELLPGDKGLSFDLGWHVDQGVRRPDVYRFLWKGRPQIDVSRIGNSGGSGPD